MLNAFPADGGLPGRPELRHRPATAADVDWIAELRAVVLRESLERIGRYDPHRVRARFRNGFAADRTVVLIQAGQPVGSLALRPEPEGTWLEHFYLASAVQGRGVGSTLLGLITARADRLGQDLYLGVLHQSPAQRLYVRHGFTLDSSDETDLYLSRPARPGR